MQNNFGSELLNAIGNASKRSTDRTRHPKEGRVKARNVTSANELNANPALQIHALKWKLVKFESITRFSSLEMILHERGRVQIGGPLLARNQLRIRSPYSTPRVASQVYRWAYESNIAGNLESESQNFFGRGAVTISGVRDNILWQRASRDLVSNLRKSTSISAQRFGGT